MKSFRPDRASAYAWLIAGLLALTTSVGVSHAQATAGVEVDLQATDGAKVFGTFTRAADRNTRILLLFHQAGANRHEYDPIIPDLTALGFDTLAIDQRAGGNRFGFPNRTAAGRNIAYLDAYPDLKGAVQWARSHNYQTIVTVGSSYSSSLNILLARDEPQAVTALASFSPGEYFQGQPDLVKQAAARLQQPFYVTTPAEESARVDEVLSLAQGDNITRYRPPVGVHGASTLVRERNPDGAAANLADFSRFLSRFANR